METRGSAEDSLTSAPPVLCVSGGEREDARLVVGAALLLGRGVDGEGRLEDPRISRRHARVTPGAGETLIVEDLGSANGTFVNGLRVSGPRVVRVGDTIRIGSTELRVEPADSGSPTSTVEAQPPERQPRATPVLEPQPPNSDGTLLYRGRRFVLSGDQVTVGRASDNTIRVPSRRVSRHHARFEATEEGFWVVDLGSGNGTHLNGRLLRAQRHALANGDTVTIAGEPIRFLAGQATVLGGRRHQVEARIRTIGLPGELLTIGRDPTNDVVLDDPDVSRFHAEVASAPDGYELRDLSSYNGTRLNGSLVDRGRVQPGSEVGIGPFLLIFGPPVAEPASRIEPDEGQIDPRRWLALSILLVAGFMDLLDTTIVNVAIPSIRTSLHATFASVQWLIDGYLLAVAVLLITGGRLGDMYGRKRVFLYSVTSFGLMSLASGLAPSPQILVVTRVLQGLSAAVMIPQILSVVQVNFPRREQSKALALYSSVAGIAVMTGPLMAGVLLDVFHLSWRSIFLINVPACVVVVVAAAVIVPESRSAHAARLDVGGVGLISCALFALVFGIIEGRAYGWPAWDIALIVAAAPLALLFARWEKVAERRGRAPLIPMGLFGERAFSAGLLVVVVFFSGLVGFFLAFTIFLQIGLGFTPLQSALTTFPSSVGLVIASQVANRLSRRLGRRLLSAGAVVMAAAQAGLIVTVNVHRAHLTAWEVRPVILVFGLGMGLILPTLADGIIAHVPERNAGAASGILNTGLQVGNAIGVAVIGIILFSSLGAHSLSSAIDQQRSLAGTLSAEGVPQAASARVLTDFRACFVDKSHSADPAANPPSCRREAADTALAGAGPRVEAAAAVATTRGRKDNFVVGIQRALSYEVAVFLLTFALLFLLPRTSGAGTGSAGADP